MRIGRLGSSVGSCHVCCRPQTSQLGHSVVALLQSFLFLNLVAKAGLDMKDSVGYEEPRHADPLSIRLSTTQTTHL